MTGGQPIDGPLTPADIAKQVAAEGREAGHRRQRRARQVSVRLFLRRHPHPPPRRARRRAARAARDSRRHGAALRPDVRGGEAPPPQARQVPGSRQARRHQRARVRRLRRLRRAIELRVGRAGGNRIRPQAHDRPVLVQQGLLVREGLLPVVRDRRRRHAAQAAEGRGARLFRPAGAPFPAPRSPTTSS